MTQGQVKPDRIWSIEGDHEIVLKQSWAILLKHFGYDLDHLSFADLEKPANFVASKSKKALPTVSKTSIVPNLPPPSERTIKTFRHLNGKANHLEGEYDDSVKPVTKHSYHHIAKHNNPLLHQAFFNSMKNDSLDNDLLRFVRARKFKLVHILEMATNQMEWKYKHHNVDKYISEGDSYWYFNKEKPELIGAYEKEKAYLRGHDLNEGKICVVRVKKHFGHDCPEADFEIFICQVIESARLTLKDYSLGTDGANILFDMSGFSLKNADLSAVRFLAKQFEANYPESLSSIWIHKAPWIFNAVWKVIKGWLDPVVASKIHFTKTTKDLENFIDKKYIPQDLGGLDDYHPTYIPPTKENSAKKPKDATYEKLVAEREQLILLFLEATLDWINAKTPEESTKLLNNKIQLGAETALNYIALDPYVRSRGFFDRNGCLGELGI